MNGAQSPDQNAMPGDGDDLDPREAKALLDQAERDAARPPARSCWFTSRWS